LQIFATIGTPIIDAEVAALKRAWAATLPSIASS
jgi:hypothetical protein